MKAFLVLSTVFCRYLFGCNPPAGNEAVSVSRIFLYKGIPRFEYRKKDNVRKFPGLIGEGS